MGPVRGGPVRGDAVRTEPLGLFALSVLVPRLSRAVDDVLRPDAMLPPLDATFRTSRLLSCVWRMNHPMSAIFCLQTSGGSPIEPLKRSVRDDSFRQCRTIFRARIAIPMAAPAQPSSASSRALA